MKLIVNIPLSLSREYLEDLDENTLPNIGDDFEVFREYINNFAVHEDNPTGGVQ